MKFIIVLVACIAWVGLSCADEVRIEDVKVVTPDGSFEEMKRQEMKDGQLIRSETISIKEAAPTDQSDEQKAAQRKELAKKRRILNQYFKHLKMTKILRNLIHNFDTPEEGMSKVVAKPKSLQRVFVIRIPLDVSPNPYHSTNKYPQSFQANSSSNFYPTTPAPFQNQIPPPPCVQRPLTR